MLLAQWAEHSGQSLSYKERSSQQLHLNHQLLITLGYKMILQTVLYTEKRPCSPAAGYDTGLLHVSPQRVTQLTRHSQPVPAIDVPRSAFPITILQTLQSCVLDCDLPCSRQALQPAL